MLALAAATLVPVFFVLALGYVAGARRIVDNQQVRSLNLLVMRFALPCALFLATAQTPQAELRSKVNLIVVLAGSMWVVYGVCYWWQRRVLRVSAGESAVLTLTVALPNYAAIGLPLVVGVLGSKSAVDVAIAIATGAVLVSPLTLIILAGAKAGPTAGAASAGVRMRHVAAHVATNPVVLGPLAGVVFALCGGKLPVPIADSLSLIGKATPGAALFLTGLVLSAQKVRLDGAVSIGVLLKGLAHPALAWGLVLLLGMHGPTARAAVLLTAIPSGFFGIMFGLAQDVRSPGAGSTLALSSVGAVLTLSAAILLTAGME